MIKVVFKKIAYTFSILLGVASLVFLLFALKPGDPVRMLGGQFVDETTRLAIEEDLGLNYSAGERYVQYLNDLSPISYYNNEGLFSLQRIRLNGIQLLSIGSGGLYIKWPYLRTSYQSKQEVTTIIANTFPSTALLAIIAISFAFIVGLVLGILSAVKKDTSFDKSALLFSVLGMSGPSFFVAILLSWVAGYVFYQFIPLPILPIVLALLFGFLQWRKKEDWKRIVKSAGVAFLIGLGVNVLIQLLAYATGWEWLSYMNYHFNLPGTGLNMTGSLVDIHPFNGEYYAWQNLILPALTLGIRPLAVMVQLTRNTLLEVLSEDYIRTAKAMGISKQKLLYKYALKNTLAPVITTISGWFASLLAGAVFVEFVFGWKGLGLTIFTALEKEDMPVVMGCVLFFSTIFVVINFLVDITYKLLDPRTR